MRKYFLLACLAGGLATPAFAQESSGFNGFRVEGSAGYDGLRGDDSLDGLVYGGGIGYDFDLGNIVAGVEAEFLESSANEEEAEAGVTSRVDVGADLYVGGRIGFRAGPATLLYAKAGYSDVDISGSVVQGADRFDLKGSSGGWRLGAGIEQLLGPNSFVKAEYRYSHYGRVDFENVPGLDPEDTEIDVNRHQVVASLGFRF